LNRGAPGRIGHISARWIACLTVLLLFSCKGKSVIEPGSLVKMHYALTVDGQVVDTSRGTEPLSFVFGSGQIIPGLEEQILGLSAGDKRSIVVAPEKGYGPINPQAIQKVPRKNFQGASDLKAGATVTAQSGGRTIQARVTQVSRDTVTVDLNHPMAGKTLNFEVEVVEVGRAADAGGPATGPS
jgi:FKBP-type peptidyl-prolyl cis-trans isomerase SlyD